MEQEYERKCLRKLKSKQSIKMLPTFAVRLKITNIPKKDLMWLLIKKSPEMNDFTKEDLEEAFQVLSSTLHRVEKAQGKLRQGTSQWTLANNRIRVLQVSLSLITNALQETHT